MFFSLSNKKQSNFYLPDWLMIMHKFFLKPTQGSKSSSRDHTGVGGSSHIEDTDLLAQQSTRILSFLPNLLAPLSALAKICCNRLWKGSFDGQQYQKPFAQIFTLSFNLGWAACKAMERQVFVLVWINDTKRFSWPEFNDTEWRSVKQGTYRCCL